MSTTPNLDELLSAKLPRAQTRVPQYSAEERARRNRLGSLAQYYALRALSKLHKDDYDALYAQAKVKVGL
jgi:hypothetical protein